MAFANYRDGQLDKYKVTGKCKVEQDNAYAETVLEWNGNVTIDARYTYVNLTTLRKETISKGDSHHNRVGVSFSAPTNCLSIRIDARHYATAVGQTWESTTSDQSRMPDNLSHIQ